MRHHLPLLVSFFILSLDIYLIIFIFIPRCNSEWSRWWTWLLFFSLDLFVLKKLLFLEASQVALTGYYFLGDFFFFLNLLISVDIAANIAANLDEDLLLSSLPLMGSSRTSGGILRGCAQGNVPNHADLATVNDEIKVPVKGEVHLYITDQYPRHINFDLLRGESDLVVMANVVESMAPILNMVAHKESVIKSVHNLCFLLI